MNDHPILIYKGTTICYNILNYFAEQLGDALKKLGYTVIYYDIEKSGLSELTQFIGQRFKAIVGFQTYAFDPFLKSQGLYLHDLIHGPKFNFQFDHPIWMRAHYEKGPRNYYVLTHDRNYQAFIKKYYPGVTDAFILPPGGSLPVDIPKAFPKTKNLVLIGTYYDYRELQKLIYGSDENTRILADAFLQEMKKHPNQTAELALKKSLTNKGLSFSDSDFLQILDSLKVVIKYVMVYYREKVVKTLLEANIPLVVYGDSWKKSPFSNHPALQIVSAVPPEGVLNELSSSKMSLNVMAWHKDGFTERIANSMLCHSVVVTDQSTCLTEQYQDGEELVIFDLMKLDALPARIKDLLSNDAKRAHIAESAFQRAKNEDLWKNRAELFLSYCDEVNIE